jgi:glycosyltransferase involved in cell wall biosynthesis
MKIAMVVPYPDGLLGKGGIAKVCSYTTRHISETRTGVAFTIVPSRWIEKAPLNHLSVLPAFISFSLNSFMQRYDIVHIHVAPRGSTWRKMLYSKIAKLANRPVVLHLHGSGYDHFFADCSNGQKKRIKEFFQSAQAVIVLGEHWRQFALSDLSIDADRIHIVSNGVPENNRFVRRYRSTPIITMMGIVGERKGVDVLLAALAMLPPNLSWQTKIAGNGELERYSKMAADYGLSEKVQFLDWIDEEQGQHLLCGSDIFVLPSRHENLPVAILEAMAAGLPVISTCVGAIPEQVIDGETGILVPPGDSSALRDALSLLIGSPELRLAFGRAGLVRYENLFSISKCSDMIYKIYTSLLNKTKP